MEQQSDKPPPFEQLAEELSKPLLRYLGRYTGDKDLAEDLLQETLLRVSRGLPGFAGRAELKTWAFSIATRVAADHFRKPANRLSIVEVAESPDTPDAERSVEQALVIDEMNACVRRVIDTLPEDYRAALVLHDLEGMTATEIAKISGCTLPTAKIRIHRARGRLAEALKGECEFYQDSEGVLRCDEKSSLPSADARFGLSPPKTR